MHAIDHRLVPAGGLALVAWALALAIVPWSRAAPLAAQEAMAPAHIEGRVVDRVSRTPVHAARVTVLGFPLTTHADSAGRFEIRGIPPGVRVLQVRAIGFAAGSWVLELREGQRATAELELEPRTVEVAPIEVTARPDDDAGWRSEAAFEQRRLSGRGFFLSRDQIRGRRAVNVTDLLRTVPGVITNCTSRGCVVLMARSTSNCRPEYFLDGYPATFATGPNFPINPVAIRGVEVYRDPQEAPPELQRPGLRCGVIAIWTIDPGERLDGRR
jgi:hypothetical protein